ncbi:MAG: hypothetical protein KAV87_43115 [Desulfobacteraceae bacterium]|nr:hypothetical protein [Desulfobacteraceae bacterium]
MTEVHIQDISGSPTTLAKYEYSLGLNGRRNSVVETDNDANETAIYFGYDALGRLTHETHADYQIAYTYDLVGNRLSKIRYAAPVCERYLFRKIGQPDTYVRRKRLLAERVLANC